MTSDTHISANRPAKVAKRHRPWWVWVLLGLGFILLLLLAVALWAWSNRYNLIEDMAIDTLAADGITAELSIEAISQTHATLRGVSLSYDGERFFAADKIRAEYQWRDAIEGRVERLIFTRPFAQLTIDETGKITDGWVPPGFGDTAGGGAFPPRGIEANGAELNLITPYGAAMVTGDVAMLDRETITADIAFEPTDFERGETRARLGGNLVFNGKSDALDAKGALTIEQIDSPAFDAQNVLLLFDGVPQITGARSFDGDITLTFDAINTAQAELGQGEIDWQGQVAQAEIGADLNGQWAAKLSALRLPDPIRTRDLARTLSLAAPLSKTPIAANFAPELERNLRTLLTDSAVTARGTAQRDAQGVTVTLSEPMTAASNSTRLTLTPAPDLPTYHFDRAAQMIDGAFDFALTRPVGISAKNARFKASSLNGIRIEQMQSFDAAMRTRETWTNNAVPAALRPFAAKISYDGRKTANRRIKISGGVDYDGPLPGGIVERLQTGGDMTVRLGTDAMAIDFTPASDGAVSIARLETPTDWVATDITAQLASAAPLYRRKGDIADITAKLSNVVLTADRQSVPARLAVTAQQADLSGTLSPSANGLSQSWGGAFTAAVIKSDNLPGPDTKIDLGGGEFTAQIATGEPLSFTLSAPTANVQTQLVRANNLTLDMAGTPDNYVLKHSGGLTKLTGNELPAMPIEGTINSVNGVFEGKAVAFLPQANNTPIDIDYQIEDSRGTARVNIPELRFRPGGLQPQSLIPTLRGKIARVEGAASATIDMTFGAGQPVTTSGRAKLINMNFGTAPGPLTGVNTEIDLASVLPLSTRGRQTLTVDRFDPGLPLENGVIDYELIEEGVKVYSARWPLGDGFFSLDPFTWKYAATENRVVLRLEKVGLGEFLDSLGDGAVQATGDLEGTFPIVIAGIDVRVDGGKLYVKDGGTIKYKAKEAEAAAQANQYAGQALEALRDFRYNELTAEMNGPLDGDIKVGLVFDGKNPKVLNGQPFAFDVGIEGELFNILRSFNTSAQIKAQLAEQGVAVATE